MPNINPNVGQIVSDVRDQRQQDEEEPTRTDADIGDATTSDAPAGPIESALEAGNLPEDTTETTDTDDGVTVGAGGDIAPIDSPTGGATGDAPTGVGTGATFGDRELTEAADADLEAGEQAAAQPDEQELTVGVGGDISPIDSPTGGEMQAPRAGPPSQNINPDVGQIQTNIRQQQAPTPGEVAESFVERPGQTIQRGGTASEFSRNIAAGALDVAFQDPGELNTGINVEQRTGGVAFSGPGIRSLDPQQLFESGERGEFDQEIAESLTQGRGLIAEETERDLREDIEARQEFFGGLGQEAEEVTTDVTGSETAGSFGQGVVGDVGGGVASLPASALLGADLATETATNLPGTVEEFGAVETAETIGEAGGRTVEQTVEQAEQDPARFAGAAAGEILLGTAAANVLERGTGGLRTRVEGRTGPDVDATETTRQPETIETGDQPTFETGTGQPGDVAAQEFRERAGEQPTELQEAVGSEQVVLRSESDRLPGDIEAQQGQFELPGLFTSADFPPLRTEASSGFSRPQLRLPRLFSEPQRASAFEAPDIDAMPEGATGSGFAVEGPEGEIVETFPDTGQGAAAARATAEEVGGQRIPDPGSSGAQFLTNQAERGTSFVRPSGSRTPEFEGIFAPETRFERVSTGTIDVGGDRGTLDIFRLADDQPDAPDAEGDFTGDMFTAAEISQRSRGGSQPEGTPVTPLPGVASGGTTTQTNQTTTSTQESVSAPTTSTGGTPTGASLFGGISTGAPTGSATGPTDAPTTESVFGSPSQPTPTGAPSGGPTAPSGGPSGAPSGGLGIPTGGPSTPSGPPTSSGFGGPSPPAFGTPSGTPFGPGVPGFGPQSPPPRRMERDRDTDSDEPEEFFTAPEGQEFQNPVASGSEFLFGGGALDFGLGTSAGASEQATPEMEAVFSQNEFGFNFVERGNAQNIFGGEP